MSQIEMTIERFFAKNPDVREARNKGLVNRRSLARYIAAEEKIPANKLGAIVMALRRHPMEKEKTKDFKKFFKSMRTSAKDNICVISLKNSDAVIEKIARLVKSMNHGPNETFKIVQGALSIKLFLDNSRLKQAKEYFQAGELIEVHDNTGEINLTMPHEVMNTYGFISCITSQLTISKINILEILTSTPELLIYVHHSELLRAYEAIKNM
ncbi:MAG: hypothetical protein KAJ91_02150 [Candidatus Aenigmarchaeota archaeon]|nr:hypothetical protein [Candidatus Aenigmarchaeota archaeon]MCK5333651.1 hypothetical protein [Candidatus Aenigmarchaeota archaeon]